MSKAVDFWKDIFKRRASGEQVVAITTRQSGISEAFRQFVSSDDYRRLIMCEPPLHDDNACKALHEYEFRATKSHGSMKEIADKYGVTIERMKEHWRCVEHTEKEKYKTQLLINDNNRKSKI